MTVTLGGNLSKVAPGRRQSTRISDTLLLRERSNLDKKSCEIATVGAQRAGQCSLLIHVIQLDLNVRRREDVIGMRRGSKHFLSLLQALSVLYLHDVLSQVEPL